MASARGAPNFSIQISNNEMPHFLHISRTFLTRIRPYVVISVTTYNARGNANGNVKHKLPQRRTIVSLFPMGIALLDPFKIRGKRGFSTSFIIFNSLRHNKDRQIRAEALPRNLRLFLTISAISIPESTVYLRAKGFFLGKRNFPRSSASKSTWNFFDSANPEKRCLLILFQNSAVAKKEWLPFPIARLPVRRFRPEWSIFPVTPPRPDSTTY